MKIFTLRKAASLLQCYHAAHFDTNKHGGMKIFKRPFENQESFNFKTITHFGHRNVQTFIC